MKGIRENISEMLVEFLKDVITQYTTLSEKELVISSSIQLPYLHPQESIMLIVDVGSLQTSTPSLQPISGIPYHDAIQYELLVGSANVHCISKLELHADRLASLIYVAFSAGRMKLSERGFLDIVPQALAEPIVIYDDETPNSISYFDIPVVLNFSIMKQYIIKPMEEELAFRKFSIFDDTLLKFPGN